MSKKVIGHNMDADGNSRCIKADYYKMGVANFLYHPNDGMSKMKKIILYDDYNNVIPKNQDVIGTVRPMFSRTALRASWKVIEYEDE